MKNELFKDPFVVLMVVSRDVRHPEELERLVTDVEYLRQERDRILNKGNPGGDIEGFAGTVMDVEWRKNNELSDNLSVSITKLAMLFLRDKVIRNFFNEEERKIMLEDMRNTVKRVNMLSNANA